jgi:hypothetical protein
MMLAAAGANGFLSMTWLLQRLDHLRSRNVLVILDSCHSGIAVPKEASSSKPGAGVRVLLTSAAPNQIEQTGADRSPLFTNALVDILQHDSCDLSLQGYCTAFELGMLARRAVLQASERQGERQTPSVDHFGADEDGDPRLDRVDAQIWRTARDLDPEKPLPDEKTIDEAIKDLKTFADDPRSPYSEQAALKIRQINIRRIREGTNPSIDNFSRVVMQDSDAGQMATSKADKVTYVWVPRNEDRRIGGFWIGRAEVSVGQFESRFPTFKFSPPGFYRGPSEGKPIVNVSHEAAEDFCKAATGGRLPHPNEWQFAAAGAPLSGTALNRFPWEGDQRPDAGAVNMAGRGKRKEEDKPGESIPAGERSVRNREPLDAGKPLDVMPAEPSRSRFSPNRVNMYHVLGNVAEWTDPENEADPPEIVGGSFADPYDGVDLSTPPKRTEPRGGNTIGFRCLIDPAAE